MNSYGSNFVKIHIYKLQTIVRNTDKSKFWFSMLQQELSRLFPYTVYEIKSMLKYSTNLVS